MVRRPPPPVPTRRDHPYLFGIFLDPGPRDLACPPWQELRRTREYALVCRAPRLVAAGLQKELTAPSQSIEADLGSRNDSLGWLRRAEENFGPTEVLVKNTGISYVEK